MNLSTRFVDKTKNFFALGLMYWMYNRPLDQSIQFIEEKFGAKDPQVAEANLRVLQAGYNYGDTTEIFTTRYDVKPAQARRRASTATSWETSPPPSGSSRRPGSPACSSSWGATRSRRRATSCTSSRSCKEFGVKTFQAEDEIAAICAAIGASYAGALAVTTTSGPGLALKTEAIGLAIMLELPLVIVDVQRGGPSTGLPTKTEQADLLQAVHGRNGEAPLCVIAAATPADCFRTVYEAARIAIKFMTPVICLTDGYLANGAEPWLIPDAERPSPDPRDVRHRPRDVPAVSRATSRRSHGPGRSPGPRASNTGSADWRRRTSPATSTTIPTTTTS